jgi:hypothetical protein
MSGEEHGYDGWHRGFAFCLCGSSFESMQDFESHVGMPTPVPSEADPGTGGHRCSPNRCCNECGRHLTPHVMTFDGDMTPIPCRFAATPDAADVEANVKPDVDLVRRDHPPLLAAPRRERGPAMNPQPPAAPETDVSAWESITLDALHAAHHRPGSITMLDLARSLAEVVAPIVAERLREVESKRDFFKAEADEWKQQADINLYRKRAESAEALARSRSVALEEGIALMEVWQSRAESAEAAREALVAGIEAWCERWTDERLAKLTLNQRVPIRRARDDLRALLAGDAR